jgi:hypothetical protein
VHYISHKDNCYYVSKNNNATLIYFLPTFMQTEYYDHIHKNMSMSKFAT